MESSSNSTCERNYTYSMCTFCGTTDQILACLLDTHKTQQLISWLQQHSQDQHCSLHSHSEHSLCAHRRVSAAYCILNSIRDGCRHFLQQQVPQMSPHDNHHDKSQDDNKSNDNANIFSKNNEKYESSFPSLSSASASASVIGTASGTASVIPNVLKTKKKRLNKNNNSCTTNGGSHKKSVDRNISKDMHEKDNNDNTNNSYINNTSSTTATATKRRIRPISTTSSSYTSTSNSTIITNNNNSNNIKPKMSSKSVVSAITLSLSTQQKQQEEVMQPSSSPWNQLFHHHTNNYNHNNNHSTTKKNTKIIDPMDRIMKSKHIVTSGSYKKCNNNHKNINTNQNEQKNDHNHNTTSTMTFVKKKSNQTKINSNNDHDNHLHHDSTSQSTNMTLFENIIQVYYTIITNLLIPSIILELQLILRLLSLNNNDNNNDDDNNSNNDDNNSNNLINSKNNTNNGTIADITTTTSTLTTTSSSSNQYNTSSSSIESKIHELFSTKSKCQQFAIKILIKLKPIIINLSNDTIVSLLRLHSFQCLLPKDMIHELHDCLEGRKNIRIHSNNDGNSSNSNNHNTLNNYEYQNGSSGLLLGVDGDGGGGGSTKRSMILNISFDAKRDSRHHFKSKDLGILYNNREQCRDTFLFQLRAFQQIRSTIIHPNEINKSLQDITKQCKEMIHVTLFSRNIPWFVDFFTELLLQIGLVPIQETDDEILNNVSDKDKLQKLHRRFTSKDVGGVMGGNSSNATQRNRSSQRLSFDSKDVKLMGNMIQNSNNNTATTMYNNNNHDTSTINTRTNMTSPDEHFTGHQEFFYRFIRIVDSYSFCIHLKNRIVSLISTMWLLNHTKGIEERIMKLQMLAKFLGVLAFSPNWIENDNHGLMTIDDLASSIPSSSSRSGILENIATPFIDMKQFIDRGWKEKKLIVTIPWAISFLQMMSWDETSIKQTYYRDVFSMLRRIHQWCIEQIFVESKYNTSNLLILVLQLESFFSEVVGIGEIEFLSLVDLPTREEDDGGNSNEVLDTSNIGLSTSFAISSSIHLEELQKLILDLSKEGNNNPAAVGSSKKLKPYVLSSYPSSLSYSLIGEKQIQDSIHSTKSTAKSYQSEDKKIISKMVDSFFHQHKELQSICDFIVDLGIKSAYKDIEKLGIQYKVKESYLKHSVNIEDGKMMILSDPVDIDWYLKILRNVEYDTYESAMMDFKKRMYTYIAKAMSAVIPSHVNDQVKDIATKISVKHACCKGESIVTSFIREEVKKNIDEHVKKGQTLASKIRYDNAPVVTDLTLSYGCEYRKLESAVQALLKYLTNTNNKNVVLMKSDGCKLVNEFKEKLDAFLAQVNRGTQGVSSIYVQSELRRIVKDLMMNLISITKMWLSPKGDTLNQPSMYPNDPPLDLLETMDLLCIISSLHLFPVEIYQFGNYFCQPFILNKILCLDDENDCNKKDVVKMLSNAIASSIIQKNHLERELMKLMKSCTTPQQTSIFCLRIIGALQQGCSDYNSKIYEK